MPSGSFPVPRPAFCRLQYGSASNKKLGVGLGTVPAYKLTRRMHLAEADLHGVFA